MSTEKAMASGASMVFRIARAESLSIWAVVIGSVSSISLICPPAEAPYESCRVGRNTKGGTPI